MTTSGRVLSEKMDVFRLSFYTAPVSCVALLPFVYLREVRLTLCLTSLRQTKGYAPHRIHTHHCRWLLVVSIG